MKNKSGFIIAAAFIGPGTVMTASLAGAEFGFHLAWALAFSVLATCLLQDMIVRLSAATRLSLSQNILSAFSNDHVKRGLALLVFLAIGIGNTAYQSGNLTGAGIGLSSLSGGQIHYWSGALGLVAAGLILSGSYKWIERVLVGLVAMMSGVFVVTLLLASPDISTLASQFITPVFDGKSISLILALIGTTLVPYNLFLQASLVTQQMPENASQANVTQMRKDNLVAIAAGGLISLVIMATSAIAFFNQDITLTLSNLSLQLEPVLGEYASLFFGIGLFSAGVTSAVTAPLAASYTITSIMGWEQKNTGFAFRAIALSIIVVGAIFASVNLKPLSLILVAQATNALMLPVVVGIVLLVMTRNKKLRELESSPLLTAMGILILVMLVGLGGYKLTGLF
jgi:NRAMP (natural resistance-associated macrophage protein)-like metal ion transporter